MNMVERDKNGKVIFEPSTMYTLSDLNQLEHGLGYRVYKLIEGIRTYWDLEKVRQEMPKTIGQHGFRNDQVYIEEGGASGETIETCLKNCSDNFYFADRWG